MTKNYIKRLLSYVSVLAVAMTLTVAPDIVSEECGEKVFAAENTSSTGRSVNEGMYAVPVPGPVTIDGDLSDWDWSGRIKMFEFYYEIDTKSVESAAMYDDKYFYFASKFKDPTPLNNPINPVTEAEWTWRGDGHQFRVWTDDKPIWLNVSYYEPTDISAIFFTYWEQMSGWEGATRIQYYTLPGSAVLDQTAAFSGTPSRIDKTGEIKWKKDDDGLGYTMEMKLPWTILYKDPSKGGLPGGKFSWLIENKWTNDLQKGTNSFTFSDNRKPGKSIGIGDYNGWGEVEISPVGNIEMRNYVVDIAKEATGSIHLYPKVPKNTKYLTLVMEDKSGNRIANIVSEFEVTTKNIVAEDEDTYTVDVTWNGKALYDDYVKAGEYVISGITHEGVKVYLDYTAYNPGTPAWATSDGKGGWGSDHCPPISVASYGNQTFVGYLKSESGYALFGLGEDGTKEWSIKRGAKYLAVTEDYLYAIPDTDFYYNSVTTGNTYIVRIDKNSGDIIPFVLNGEPRITELTIGTILSLNQEVKPEIKGFAAYGQELYVSTAANNTKRTVPGGLLMNYTSCINVIDAQTGEFKRRIAVPDVGQIAVSKDGKLYAVSGDKIVCVNRETGRYSDVPIKLDEGMKLGALNVDKDGNVIVFDQGSDRQIKAYNTNTGAKVYTIGKKGGRALVGYYDETGFSHMVTSISADAAGHIWAAEYWEYPRRVSCWNTDGTVYKDYVGTAGYMSAGAVTHQTDPNLVYVGANELTVDHETKTTKMNRILWVPDYSKNQAYPISPMSNTLVQHATLEVNGVKREYIFGQSTGATAVIYMENDKGYFQPVTAMGRVGDFIIPDLTSTISSSEAETLAYFSDETDLYRKRYMNVFNGIADNTFYIWNDLNGDAVVQIEECEFNTTMKATNDGWGHRMTSDFRFILQSTGTELNAGGIWMVSPTEITENGVPRYSFNSFKHLEGVKTDGYNRQEAILLDGTNKVLIYSDNSGSTVEKHNGVWVVDMDTGAKQDWWYLNQYPGVHGSHSSTVGGKNGQIIGPIKCMGIINVGGEEIFALRGNVGQDFFMTTDGYYVETVFNDGRKTGTNQNLPTTYMDPIEFSKIDFTQGSETGEPFSGCLVYQDDGVVRMGISTGGPCAVITRLEGLDTIERIEKFNFKVTPDMIKEAKEFNKALESASTSVTIGDDGVQKSIVVNKVEYGAINIDGNGDEWSDLEGTSVSKAGIAETAQVKLAHDGQNLYAMFYVNDRSPMANKGNDYAQLFKTGDAVDIQLSPTNNNSDNPANNDMRIVISKYAGKPVAVLMQQSSSTGKNQKLYASPTGNIYFDNVEIIKDAEIEIMSTEEGAYYVVEAKIPFKSIGVSFKSGEFTKGDIGFIASDDAGTVNLARVYLFNKDTGLTNDVPNEAKLVPKSWGSVEFK